MAARTSKNSDWQELTQITQGRPMVVERVRLTEKEVAIDPEMLGKVFENLIEENLRKGLGSYYTPREIVHYMCQESLINYLDTAINIGEESVVRAIVQFYEEIVPSGQPAVLRGLARDWPH